MHCARGGEKLRRQRLAASHLTVVISTSRFRQNPKEIYSGAASWRLPFHNSYTPDLVDAARSLLNRIYKPGFVYHKAGVFLTDIVADAERQQSLLLRIDDERRIRPAYSPDFSPIKNCWSKVKALVRGRQPQTPKELNAAPSDALAAVTLNDIEGWFRHCGY
jgi:hypothetical protein